MRKIDKRPIVVVTVMLILTVIAIIVANSISLKGFRPGYSISRYVGSATWSVWAFLSVNVIVAGLLRRYLYSVGQVWQMKRGFYWTVVMMVVGLIGLSVWPIGYFDQPGMDYAMSVPSHAHEICSRLMFICMIVMVGLVLICQRASQGTRLGAAIYVAYGLVCALGFLLKAPWFVQHMLLFESVYLFGFLGFCLGMRSGDCLKVEQAETRKGEDYV